MKHELKILPQYFEAVLERRKTFEIRKNDRDYKVGDALVLNEWTPENGYTGRRIARTVTYILEGGQFGIEKKFVVMSIL